MKVFLRTFGCRANHYDTEAVRELVLASGHEVVSSVNDADVAIFNSCTVTTDAEADLRQAVRRAASDRPALQSLVMGCAAALDDAARPAGTRLRELPTVNAIVGGADLVGIAEALQLAPPVNGPRTVAQSGARALLRIQDGCDEHCTFCATTIARGANRSRTIDELVREAEALAERHSEIVITGIHIGTYGADRGTSLGELMNALVREVPVVRFRLSSIEATELDEPLVELMAGAPDRLAPHVHAPLQSGSDRLLKRMGRSWYTSATYSDAIERLATRVPTLGLGADVIAGFPGETDDDHAATLRMVESLPFTYVHVFPYSARPGTAAVRLPNAVPSAAIRRRAAELRALSEQKAEAFVTRREGGRADVIVIGRSSERQRSEHQDSGRTDRAVDAEGLTGDYLTVCVRDASVGRGDRFFGTLVWEDGRLVARRVSGADYLGSGSAVNGIARQGLHRQRSISK